MADIPIHAADPISRRSAPLQQTADAKAPEARLSSTTMTRLGLQSGIVVRVRSASGEASVVAATDDGVADGCVRLAGAHSITAPLGSLYGEISLERV